MGFGRTVVSSDNRVPSPPAKTTAFTKRSPVRTLANGDGAERRAQAAGRRR
jgi:hypothetical protein